MKKHSMLWGASLIVLANIYGIVIASYFKPTTYAMIITSLLAIGLVTYVQLQKQDILLETKKRLSYLLFACIILFQLYFTITALALLVYLNNIELTKTDPDSKLVSLVVGIKTMDFGDVEKLNLPYYFSNFLLFVYYLRCFYVMFWRENIVFIYRYLKSRVKQLNQTLLSNMPRIQYNKDLKDTICSLCLEEYKPEERITRLHCTHIYHIDCVKVWVLRSNCCPLCRKRVVF